MQFIISDLRYLTQDVCRLLISSELLVTRRYLRVSILMDTLQVFRCLLRSESGMRSDP